MSVPAALTPAPAALDPIALIRTGDMVDVLPGPAEHHGGHCHKVVRGPEVYTLPPSRLLPEQRLVLPRAATPMAPPLFLARLEGAACAAHGAFLSPAPGTLVYEEATMWPLHVNGRLYGARATLAATLARPGVLPDDAFDPDAAVRTDGAFILLGLINHRYLDSWFHWLIELLPKMYVLSRFPELSGLPVIMRRPVPGAQQDSLAALGMPPGRLALLDAPAVRPDVLYVPSQVGMPAFPSPVALDWTAETILASLGLTDAAGTRLIYATRGAARRAVANEAAFLPALRNLGFQVVDPACLPFREQVRLYREARVVVVPHGAGLANILFCRPGTLVVELTPAPPSEAPFVHAMYSSLAASRRLTHLVVAGSPADAAGAYGIDPLRLMAALTAGLRDPSSLPPIPWQSPFTTTIGGPGGRLQREETNG